MNKWHTSHNWKWIVYENNSFPYSYSVGGWQCLKCGLKDYAVRELAKTCEQIIMEKALK